MTEKLPQLGAQDPELKNSPILRDDDEDIETLRGAIDDGPICYFNDVAHTHGALVRSGTATLRCDHGIWVFAGPADTDNP